MVQENPRLIANSNVKEFLFLFILFQLLKKNQQNVETLRDGLIGRDVTTASAAGEQLLEQTIFLANTTSSENAENSRWKLSEFYSLMRAREMKQSYFIPKDRKRQLYELGPTFDTPCDKNNSLSFTRRMFR